MFQDDEVDLYVGIAKCLSEMSDTEIERITRVTEVQCDPFSLLPATRQARLTSSTLCVYVCDGACV